MTDLKWPDRWQPEAIAAAAPYVDTDHQLDIRYDDPVNGTLMGGYLFRDDDGTVMIIHDHSGRPDVYPWRLLAGPVVVIKLLRPRRRPVELYRHPAWSR